MRLRPRGQRDLATWHTEAGLLPVPAAMVPGGVLGVRASGVAMKVGSSAVLVVVSFIIVHVFPVVL